MRFSKKITAAAIASAITAPAFAGPDEDILFRQLQIRTMGYSAVMLGAISQGRSDEEEHFTALANQMAHAATMLKDAFEADTRGEGQSPTRAKDNIWENWDDFAGKLDKLEADTARVAELANDGDLDGAKQAVGTVFGNCKACHDTYRSE